MFIHETWLCSLLGSESEFAYGFEFHYSPDGSLSDDELSDSPVFDIQVGRIGVGMEHSLDQEYVDKAWVADAFVNSIHKPGTIIGFQISSDNGECYGERPSFEVLCADTACAELIKAGPKGWALAAIYEGDIEEPSFCTEPNCTLPIVIQA